MPPKGKPISPPRALSARPAFVTALVCCGLFAGTMLLFMPSVGYDFLNYDDPSYVTQNPHVLAGLEWNSFVWAFTGHTDYWHPLSWLSHMVDCELFGANAAGHHLTSITWHAANAVLVFLVMRRLTGSFWTSAFSAALFAWHPLRVESVVWITERKDVMSGCFFLLTLWAYAGYATRRRAGGRAAGLYCLTLACFACGLMTKPMLVTLPVVLLLLDFWPLRRAEEAAGWRVWRDLLIEKLPFFGLSAVVSIVTVQMQGSSGALVLDLPLLTRLGNSVVSIARYLGKFFWPVDLVVCYPRPGHWPVYSVGGAVALVAVITFVAWRRRHTQPCMLTGWAWFLVMLAPVIGIMQTGFQAMADRYTYLPILGLQTACLWSLRGFGIRPAVRPVVGVLGVAILLALAAATWRQEAYWRNSVTLFEHAVAVDNQNPMAHGFLGYTLATMGRLGEAEGHARTALETDRDNTVSHLALAIVAERRGDPEGAISAYREVLERNPRNGIALIELGELLLRLGRIEDAGVYLRTAALSNPELGFQSMSSGSEALREDRLGQALIRFQTACIVEPNEALAHFWCGFTLARLNRVDEALAELERAAALQPGHAGTQVEIGMILLRRRDAAEALGHFQAAAKAQKDLGVAHLGVGRALLQLGRYTEAKEAFETAFKYSPNDPVLHKAWAETLARNKEFDQAAAHYARVVELDPRDAEAHAGYGYMLLLTQRRTEAIREWEEALRLNPDLPGIRDRLENLRRSNGQ